jgi:predicted phage terminase large subunit-like protein
VTQQPSGQDINSQLRYGASILLAERSLRDFVEQAWPVMEPSTPYVHGWHIDAICDLLESASRGEVRRFVINIPPRHGKSLIFSVFWQAWSWIERPWLRWLFSSYASNLAIRDSVKARRLIASPWYKERWGSRYSLTDDQNQKVRFENDRTGYRIAASVDGANTGEGGDIIGSDDPNNVREAESEIVRVGTNEWWDEVMSTRGNDPRTVVHGIVQQRTHYNDLTGHVLEKEADYVHLCLPAEYESDHPHIWDMDPRKKEGDLLWPERFGPQELADLKQAMNSTYAVAGQLQQRPAPRSGGIFKRDMFRFMTVVPENPPGYRLDAAVVAIVRAWDNAASEGGGDYTVGVLMMKYTDGTYAVVDVVRGQWESSKRDIIKKQTAIFDRATYGPRVRIRDVQDPGAAGKDSAKASVRNLAGFSVVTVRPTGDKETRAEPLASQQQMGNVALVIAPWNDEYVNELAGFPSWAHDDQVDSSADAFNEIEKMPPSLLTQGRDWGMKGNEKKEPSLMAEIKRDMWKGVA